MGLEGQSGRVREAVSPRNDEVNSSVIPTWCLEVPAFAVSMYRQCLALMNIC